MESTSGLYQATLLETGADLLQYHLDGGVIPDADGNVQVRVCDGRVRTLPLKGLYVVRPVQFDTPYDGPGVLLTRFDYLASFASGDDGLCVKAA